VDLWFLSHRYPYHDEVDLGFHALKDQTIKAEVWRYRGLDAKLNNLLYDLQQVEEHLGQVQMEKDQCVRRLEQANTLERMAEANEGGITEARGQVTELLQDMERGCST
jgi:septal ring factor EnvC (AmiA/AmiB activator)